MATNATLTAQQAELLNSLAASLLPDIFSSNANLDALHRHAVELMKRGQSPKAQRLFRFVRGQAEASANLVAWTWYKEGEIYLESGLREQAQACFEKALAFTPGHVKAQLRLHPPLEPLRVIHGQRQDWHPAGIALDFPCNDLELWEYYLGFRAADELWLMPPAKVLDFGLPTLRALCERYLSPGGEIVLGRPAHSQSRIACAELAALVADGEPACLAALRQCLERCLPCGRPGAL